MNHRWNSSLVSMAPPPTTSASGSKVLIISSKNTPSACACTRKISLHMGSPFSRSELFTGFDGAPAHHQRIGVEGVDHLVEEYAERMRLHAENFLAHGIAFLQI